MGKQKKEITGMTHTNKVYVTHTCKNSKLNPKDPNYCNRAWVDVDKTHVRDVPQLGNIVLNVRKKAIKILKQKT